MYVWKTANSFICVTLMTIVLSKQHSWTSLSDIHSCMICNYFHISIYLRKLYSTSVNIYLKCDFLIVLVASLHECAHNEKNQCRTVQQGFKTKKRSQPNRISSYWVRLECWDKGYEIWSLGKRIFLDSFAVSLFVDTKPWPAFGRRA